MKIIEKSIISNNNILNQVKASKFKHHPENDNFFRQIEDTINFYNQKAASVEKTFDYYNEFIRRIDEQSKIVDTLVNEREKEKNELIQYIQNGVRGSYDSSSNLFLLNF